MRSFSIIFVLRLASCAACTPIDRDRILMADIAEQVDGFEQLAPELVVGPAPFPKTNRTFLVRELLAIAKRYGVGLKTSPRPVCFERRLTPLTAESIAKAIESSIGKPGARVDVLDFSRQPMPSGELVFPRSGLTPPPTDSQAPALWRGTLRYSAQHTLPVWASVRIRQELSVVLAVRQIPYGTTISNADVTVAQRELFPFTPHVETTGDVVGRRARKSIPEGGILSSDTLEILPDIGAGETVHVVAANGAARISFDAVARSPGRTGERIVLLNPESHRTFRAVVDGKGRAHIGDGT